MPLACAAASTDSTAASTTRSSRTGTEASVSLPLMMRETSSRSSMRRIWARALRSMASNAAPAASPCELAPPEHPDPREHGVERRPQLVRDRGEELVLGAVRLARLAEDGVLDRDRRHLGELDQAVLVLLRERRRRRAGRRSARCPGRLRPTRRTESARDGRPRRRPRPRRAEPAVRVGPRPTATSQRTADRVGHRGERAVGPRPRATNCGVARRSSTSRALLGGDAEDRARRLWPS